MGLHWLSIWMVATLGIDLIGECFKYVSKLFPHQRTEIEEASIHALLTNMGQIGGSMYTTMGLTHNYVCVSHLDTKDLQFSLMFWLKGAAVEVQKGGEFVLPGYGLHFVPRSRTMMAIRTPSVWHGSRAIVAGSTIGIALAWKQIVLKQAMKREMEIREVTKKVNG